MVLDLEADKVLGLLDEMERHWVKTFRSRLNEEFGRRLRDLRLFGSKLRGDDHPESDIDLLVLIEGGDDQTRHRVFEMAYEMDVHLQPHVRDYEEYHSPRSRATGFNKEMRKASARL